MKKYEIEVQYIPIFKDNYIWLIINSIQKKVIAVDPGEASSLKYFLNSHHLTLEAILITHHHADHTQGIPELAKSYPEASIFGPKQNHITGLTNLVEEGDIIELSMLNDLISVLSIPGHTLDHLAYYLPGMIFCGDTLFSAGCGRVFEGTIEQMFSSLQRIAALPNETLIYCAHEYTLQNLKFAQVVEHGNQDIQQRMDEVIALINQNRATIPTHIGDEKKYNIFLRCQDPTIIKCVEQHVGRKLNNPVNVFEQLRKWKNALYIT